MLQPAAEGAARKTRRNMLTARAAHAPRSRGILDQPFERIRKSRWRWRPHKTRHAVNHGLSRAAAIGHYHRAPCGHRFERNIAEMFLRRGMDQAAAVRYELPKFPFRHRLEEQDLPLQVSPARQRL